MGVDASSASADPARAPWRSTASSCQEPGTPRSSTLPRSSKPVPEPTTRSRTVRETRMSPAPAWPQIRAAMCTAMPPDVVVEQFAFAGVDAGADLDAQRLDVRAQRLGAADGLRRAVEGGEVAVAGVLHHRAAESFREVGGDLTKALQHRTPPLVARRRGVLRRRDDVGEQHGAQGAM